MSNAIARASTPIDQAAQNGEEAGREINTVKRTSGVRFTANDSSGKIGLGPPDGTTKPPRGYFAAAGNTGNLATSRWSCWMITVAFRFFAICLKRSIDASEAARSVLNVGTPLLS